MDAVHIGPIPLGSPAPEPWARRVDALLDGIVDACLAGAVTLVPACVGGRIALGQLVLVVLAFGAGTAWCLRQAMRGQAPWQWCGAEVLLACAVALPWLQVVELPPAVVDRLSPLAARVGFSEGLPGSAGAELGPWRRLSLDPSATREALVMVAAFAVLILAAAQRLVTLHDVQRMLHLVALAALLAAAIAVVQYLAGTSSFLGVFAHPFASASGGIQGSFSNRNHFAHFIALGLGPIAACALWAAGNPRPPGAGGGRVARQRVLARGTNLPRHSQAGPKRSLATAAWTAALAFSIVAGLASLSRGGMLAMMAAAIVGGACLLRHASLRGRLVVGGAAATVLVLACLATWRNEALARRLDTFQSLETLDQNAGRRRLWKANLAAWADAPWLGTGLGTHAAVCPMYLEADLLNRGVEYTHAENGYCQVLSEAGLVGLGLVLAAFGIVAAPCMAAARQDVCDKAPVASAAVAAGLAASAVHAAVDFVWYVPGCMVVVAMLGACALRLGQWARLVPGRSKALVLPWPAWLALAGALMIGGGMAATGRLRAVVAERCEFRAIELRRMAERQSGPSRRATLAQIAAELEEAVYWRPDHARAHARLATVLLEWFNTGEKPGFRGLTVHDVCQAALASRFASREEMLAWLSRALQERSEALQRAWQHARRAVQLCPLYTEAYLALADLCFLDGPEGKGPEAYLAHAARLRPHDAAVLLAVGQQAAEQGRLAEAAGAWKAAFRAGPAAQRRMIDRLAEQLPGRVFLELFEPDAEALELLADRYRQLQRTEDLRLASHRRAELLERRANGVPAGKAASTWLAAARAWDEAQRPDDALCCLQQAVCADPGNYEARLALGQRLQKVGDFEAAEKHLRWCALRRPHDRTAQAALEKTVLGRLRGPLHAERETSWSIPR